MSSNKKNKDEIIKELNKAEEIIKKDINKIEHNVDICFKEYGLLNTKWFQKYLNFLENLNDNQTENFSYKYRDLEPIIEDKDYSYINEKMRFSFPINFSFVTKETRCLLSEYNYNEKDKKRIKDYLFGIIIGGGCIIMSNRYDQENSCPYNYIILYEETEGNKNRNVDYILMIKDKKERKNICKYILKHNIWNYLKKNRI